MIRSLSDLTLDGSLTLIYSALASAVSAGAVLGVAGAWLSIVARGGRSS